MIDRKLRIVWMSNAPWSQTGYGQQTAINVPRIQRSGRDVAILAYYGFEGAKHRINGTTYYGIMESKWGDDALPHAVLDFRADVAISLMDVFVLPENLGAQAGLRWCPWFPVDHYPAPDLITSRLRGAYRPIAMSRFGLGAVRETGVWADYVPHGIETRTFRPTRSANRRLKAWLGFPEESFLVGMVAANKGHPCRKGFPEAFEAFGAFARRVPEARLYVHTVPDVRWGGIDLRALARRCGINLDQFRFMMPHRFSLGIPSRTMAQIYNAFDVLLQPSYGEGFGIPIVEAQACGTPVIGTDFSSIPELLGPAGWPIKAGKRYYTLGDSWQFMPDPAEIQERLFEAHAAWSDRRRRREISAACREFAVRYDADRVFSDYWEPWLAGVERELGIRTVEARVEGAVAAD